MANLPHAERDGNLGHPVGQPAVEEVRAMLTARGPTGHGRVGSQQHGLLDDALLGHGGVNKGRYVQPVRALPPLAAPRLAAGGAGCPAGVDGNRRNQTLGWVADRVPLVSSLHAPPACRTITGRRGLSTGDSRVKAALLTAGPGLGLHLVQPGPGLGLHLVPTAPFARRIGVVRTKSALGPAPGRGGGRQPGRRDEVVTRSRADGTRRWPAAGRASRRRGAPCAGRPARGGGSPARRCSRVTGG